MTDTELEQCNVSAMIRVTEEDRDKSEEIALEEFKDTYLPDIDVELDFEIISPIRSAGPDMDTTWSYTIKAAWDRRIENPLEN